MSGSILQFPGTTVHKIARPMIDVVVPVYNNPEDLKTCVTTLERLTSTPHRTWIVDDASEDPGVSGALRTLSIAYPAMPSAQKNPQNAGFAPTCNRGARMGTAPYICFLNTDVVLSLGCLDVLYSEMEADKSLAIAGPLLTFPEEGVLDPARPPGMVQSCGFTYNVGRQPMHRLIGWHPEHPKVQMIRKDLQGITGAVIMVRRDFFQEVGGFFEPYSSTFEDAELGILAKARGHNIGYFPKAKGTHRVGSSCKLRPIPYQRNAQLFLQRVGGFIRYDEHKCW